MRATLELVDNFCDFARHQVANGGADLTIDELYARWREERECDETVRVIEQSLADFDAGRAMTLEEADVAIRRQLGFPAA